MKISNLDLFFKFIKGDHRSSDKFVESKKGLPVKELDCPLLTYSLSLQDRIRRLYIISSKIEETHDAVIEDIKRLDEIGHGSLTKSLELNIYYEALLNEIYSIMENVARINLFMFDESHDLPHRFTDQVKNIKNRKLSLHSKYDKLMVEEMDWYTEINVIRDNIAHFLTGLAIFGRTDDETPLPQYLSYNMSNRQQHIKSEFRIEKNILDSSKSFFEDTMKTLEIIAQIYVERMDKDVICHMSYSCI